MLIPTNTRFTQPQRRGIILLVVVAMLALFAALGLSFVYYAQSEADAARFSTQAQTQNFADIDPEFLMSYSLGQLIFGVDDISAYGTNNNVYSALRGHDLARNMYGYRRNTLNVTPFNGIQLPNTVMDPIYGGAPFNQPFANLINFQYYPPDGFVRDPGRPGASRALPTAAYAGAGTNYVGENVPWTYADLNSVYLGQMNGAGEVLIQSFWRNWTTGGATLVPTDPWWRQYDASQPALAPPAWSKYATLRPIPWFNRGNPSNPGVTGFPPPADGGGDVRNIDFGPGVRVPGGGNTFYNNDSIWIDLGFPVRIGPNGKLYKPLFAPFIMDLDGKVNLNVVGNLRRQQPLMGGGFTYEHGSTLGLGPWEINPNQVLTAADWRNVLHHRYDQNFVPGQAASALNTTPGNAGWSLPAGMGGAPPFWGFMDFDGVRDAASNYATSDKIYLPGDPGVPPGTGNQYAPPLPAAPNQGRLVPFPYIPLPSYGGGIAVERASHPALFNPINPNYVRSVPNGGDGTAANDRLHRLSQLEALYRYGGTGSPSLTADLFRLAPQCFYQPPITNSRLNVTLLSADLARPGITPWLQPATSAYGLGMTGPTLNAYPNFGGGGLPAAAPTATSPNLGEYGPDYRGFAGTAPGSPANTQSTGKRLNINRFLSNYPAPVNGIITDMIAYKTAVDDRQQLARDIFDYLRFVTTGARPGAALPAKTNPESDEFKALRWLAQLAVNIVDFRDIDEYVTPFPWYRDPLNPMAPPEYVFGTELPQVVVNEVYAEIVNDPMDTFNGNTMATMDYKINFWIELLNPLMNETLPPLSGARTNRAVLQNANGPVYKLQIVQPAAAGGSAINTNDAANVLGVTNPAATVHLRVEDFTPAAGDDPFPLDPAYHYVVNAVHTNTGPPAVLPMKNDTMMMMKAYHPNNGFYVMGPQKFPFPPDPMAPTNPVSVRVQQLPAMGMIPEHGLTRTLPVANDPTTVPPHSVILRRLACPHLPADNNPNSATYNPYVTVDYLDNIPIRRGATYNDTMMIPLANRDLIATWPSKSRSHPYRAKPLVDSTTNAGPMHSMFSHHDLAATFQWLVHLDRNYTSPAELFHVSGYRPFQLTQEFYNAGGTAHSQRAPWTTSAARIYRFLEYVDTGYRMAGVSQDGRVPGKININTIWDEAVFQALCDPNLSVNFTAPNVTAIFNNLRSSRTVNPTPGPADRPFRSLAAAHEGPPANPANDGINATILRDGPVPGTPWYRVPGATHPQQQNELISKIFNNVTTRSNVFAVWMTVGFFEVHEWSNAPAPGTHYELGKEIGKDENRHIRHRMFSIVDRTELVLPNANGPDGVSFRNAPATFFVAPANRLVVPTPVFTTQAGPPFTTQPGDQIPLEVTYQTPAGATVTDLVVVTVGPVPWTFNNVQLQQLNATPNVQVTLRGNPGPQLRFDHRQRQYAPLVPYYSIIQ